MKTTGLKRILGGALCGGALLIAAPAVSADQAFEWPRLLVIGTPGTASGSFISTNAWAPILQKEVGTVVRIVPEDSETMRYRRLTDRKDIAISSVTAAEMRFQVEGVGGYINTIPAPQRIVWHHNDSPWGYVVSGDSDLTALDDLKNGKVRVAQGMFSPPMTVAVREALPAFLGMSEAQTAEHFQYVPASSYAENCRSVVEGKADVAYCATISAVVSEMEGAPGGIRWLPMTQSNTEGWKRYLGHRPMLVPTTIDQGVDSARGVEGATSNFLYTVTADADAGLVYNLSKWMHQSYDQYQGKHPLAARMSLEQFRAYLDRTPLPVHEGTVKYLREIGEWSDQDEQHNQQAIEKMDRWIAARRAAVEEAREAGVKVDFQNPAFLEIQNKHTDGLDGFRSRI
ncbi:TAXI family TRAP transporter solute-binding subunit [Alloalcanivorax sp. C16-2]|uniref:TAXI family TRAP transporter solute-binding subunit n=1 Tax=Alloalcanivorax TaxID=3020832 RepID=UPI001934AF13|nr:TAXI family TRAP transporter solute-binding subunit [Alloalcanivorax marinus]MBL7249894.1 TAXI family TRAP transporter solute-binding subunit [Alloalcanivorax marinus]